MNIGLNQSMDIKCCSRCGRMFPYMGIGSPICNICRELDEKEFNAVKEYIYQNMEATVKDVSMATGVRSGRIKAFLRDGRLIIPDKSAVFLDCESCGASIKFGRICKECANTLSKEIKKEMNICDHQVGEKPKKTAARMRFLKCSGNQSL